MLSEEFREEENEIPATIGDQDELHPLLETPALPQTGVHSCETIHAIPGRARLHLPWINKNARHALIVEHVLGSVEGVRTVRANAATNKVLVEYNTRSIDLDGIVQCVETIPLAATLVEPDELASTQCVSQNGIGNEILRGVLKEGAGTVIASCFGGMGLMGVVLRGTLPVLACAMIDRE